MQTACRHLFQKVLLKILAEFTSEERAQFLFYCEKRPTSNARTPVPDEDILALFCDLKESSLISSSDVSFLTEFTNTIGRIDLTKVLKEYESEIEFARILEEYADFRDGELCDLTSKVLSTTQTISESLSRNFRDSSEILTTLASRYSDTDIEETMKIYLDEILFTDGQLSWQIVLQILGFSSELAYRRMCFCPGPSKIQRWLTDIKDIRLALRNKIVPWMARNGGAAGCLKSIAKQDQVEMEREIRALVMQLISEQAD